MALVESVDEGKAPDGLVKPEVVVENREVNGKPELRVPQQKLALQSRKDNSPSPLSSSFANLSLDNTNAKANEFEGSSLKVPANAEDKSGKSAAPNLRFAVDQQPAPNEEEHDADSENDNVPTSTPIKSGLRRLTQRESVFRRKLSSTRIDGIENDHTPSKLNPRKPFGKSRSKSDVEVGKTRGYLGKPLDTNYLRPNNVLDNEVHSDTEISPNPNPDDQDPGLRPPEHQGTRRKFMSYMGGQNTFHPTAGEPSQSPGMFRRISQFNTEGISRNFRKYTTLNFFTRRREEVRPEEYERSGELLSEILSVTPSVLILASSLLHDNKRLRKVPVLLEQIRFTFTELVPEKAIKINVEYGSGSARISWCVTKNPKMFEALHSDLKKINRIRKLAQKSYISDKPRRRKVKFPKLPVPAKKGIRRSSFSQGRNSLDRVSTRTERGFEFIQTSSEGDTSSENESDVEARGITGQADTYIGALYEYFMGLLHKYQFSGDANRILEFLELSNMSIRLAAEHSFHGKEGKLTVGTFASDQGWRVSHWRAHDIEQTVARHRSKWFLVRHSYIVCVDNISATNILEVFLVDKAFKITSEAPPPSQDPMSDEDVTTASNRKIFPSHDFTKRVLLKIENNERMLKMVTASGLELASWVDSINKMKDETSWSKNHLFDSFAPVRRNVHAQWFVDARDYFWSVSEAISNAKDVIYIHDWWLSPELYLRRPAQGNQKWRLDRLLKSKASEGVKIFVIVYRNYGQTVPIDSAYTKYSLLDLHPNIYVMRSPNQWLQNTYFWAHHEKLCLIDHSIAYLGGIDLCFGRFDTPDHVLTDDKQDAFFTNPRQEMFPETQMWPGKDYSNPRVQDFHNLHDPYEDMYDRDKVPRMPWHDVHMMVTGQPARDLVRHFVQRWNFLIRQKRPSRNTPLLLPPPDFTEEEMQNNGMAGTCEVQILRSSCLWSLGIKDVETSIQNAYVAAIEDSEHFVYIENQFFITSTTVDGTKIENKIGDALVKRIQLAHEQGENWRCVIIIPLMPGFESQVDMAEGSSVRVIMQCQYTSISIGTDSIFNRLDRMGILPEDYIQFFSLRKWGKIGRNKKIVTEQLYVHAKCMIVDDRVAIIGSANINERSMRGNRDSEIAAIVRDSHLIDSVMGGEPYKVGKFAHSLRIRLMSEHLGVDLDTVELINSQLESLMNESDEDGEYNEEDYYEGPPPTGASPFEVHSFNHCAGIDNIGLREQKAVSIDNRVQNNKLHKDDVLGLGKDGYSVVTEIEKRREELRRVLSEEVVEKTENLISEAFYDNKLTASSIDDLRRRLYEQLTDTTVHDSFKGNEPDIIESLLSASSEETNHRTSVNPFNLHDPLDEYFYSDVWVTIAKTNTEIFSEVFKCQPDNKVETWKDYKSFMSYGEQFSTQQDQDTDATVSSKTDTLRAHDPLGTMKDDNTTESAEGDEKEQEPRSSNTSSDNDRVKRIVPAQSSSSMGTNNNTRRKRANTKGLKNPYMVPYNAEHAEKILKGVKGNLVLFPTSWLQRELTR